MDFSRVFGTAVPIKTSRKVAFSTPEPEYRRQTTTTPLYPSISPRHPRAVFDNFSLSNSANVPDAARSMNAEMSSLSNTATADLRRQRTNAMPIRLATEPALSGPRGTSSPPPTLPLLDDTHKLHSEIARLQQLLAQAQAETDAALNDLDAEHKLSSAKDAEIRRLELETSTKAMPPNRREPSNRGREPAQLRLQLRDVQADQAQEVLSRAAQDVRQLKLQNALLEAKLQDAVGAGGLSELDRKDLQDELDGLQKLVAFYKKNSQGLSADVERARVFQRQQQLEIAEKDRKLHDLEVKIDAMNRLASEYARLWVALGITADLLSVHNIFTDTLART